MRAPARCGFDPLHCASYAAGIRIFFFFFFVRVWVVPNAFLALGCQTAGAQRCGQRLTSDRRDEWGSNDPLIPARGDLVRWQQRWQQQQQQQPVGYEWLSSGQERLFIRIRCFDAGLVATRNERRSFPLGLRFQQSYCSTTDLHGAWNMISACSVCARLQPS